MTGDGRAGAVVEAHVCVLPSQLCACVAACGLDLVVAILVSRPVCFSWVVDVGAACATLVSL